MWREVINCGCDALYSVSNVKHIVGAMSYIQRVWYHGKCGCEKHVQWMWWYKYSEYFVVYNGYDVDINRGWDLIDLQWYHQQSGCGDRNSVDTMSNIVNVMSYVVHMVSYI